MTLYRQATAWMALHGIALASPAIAAPAQVTPVAAPGAAHAQAAQNPFSDDPARVAVEQLLLRQSNGLPGKVSVQVVPPSGGRAPECVNPEPFLPAGAAPYGRVPLAIAVRKGTKLEVSPAGLKDKRIAVQRSTRWGHWLREAGAATVVELETPDEVQAALSTGKVDGALLDRRRTATWLASPAGVCCELAKPDIRAAAATGPGIAFLLRSDIKLKELVEKAMAGLRNDGTVQKLAAKHLPFPLM